jgi:hypothetical protein
LHDFLLGVIEKNPYKTMTTNLPEIARRVKDWRNAAALLTRRRFNAPDLPVRDKAPGVAGRLRRWKIYRGLF